MAQWFSALAAIAMLSAWTRDQVPPVAKCLRLFCIHNIKVCFTHLTVSLGINIKKIYYIKSCILKKKYSILKKQLLKNFLCILGRNYNLLMFKSTCKIVLHILQALTLILEKLPFFKEIVVTFSVARIWPILVYCLVFLGGWKLILRVGI